MSDIKFKGENNGFFDKTAALLLMIAVAAIPLIVRIRIVPVGVYEYGIIRASSSINDMFSYNKAVAVCIDALVIAIYFAIGIVLEEKRVKLRLKALPSYIMYGYIGLCIISSVFSKYTSIAFWGISERYEGFFVLLGYAVFFILAMSFVTSERSVNCMLLIFSLSVLIIGTIAAMQTFGFDIFATETGSKLVLGQYYGGETLSLKFDSAYGTLYNPNCLGMYAGMMSSFMLVPAVLSPVKSKRKYLFILLFVLAVISMLGSDSVGGLMGFALACVFVLLIGAVCFIKKRLYKNRLYIVGCAAAAAAAILIPAVLSSANAVIVQKAKIIVSGVSGGIEDESPYFYEDFAFDADTASIATKAGTINITAADGEPVVEQNGIVRDIKSTKAMPDTDGGHEYTYDIDGLAEGILQVYDDKLIFIGCDEQDNRTNFLMRRTENGIIPLDKFGNDINIDENVASAGFEGIERLGSGRGYIWSRSIPIALKNIIIGKGPDSFALEFPQHDIVAKLKYLGNPYIIVDKPHNIYLQSAVNTGVLSVIAIAALVLIFIAKTALCVVRQGKMSAYAVTALACAAGVIAYMTAGLTTDSAVSVAPVFWVMLGTGYGTVIMMSTEDKNGKD